jgi:hypothetical protein
MRLEYRHRILGSLGGKCQSIMGGRRRIPQALRKPARPGAAVRRPTARAALRRAPPAAGSEVNFLLVALLYMDNP